MSWRFRKTFKILPGVRLNVSKSGISTSIGAAPFTVNFGPRGVTSTASLPGTGVSFRRQVGAQAASAGASVPSTPEPNLLPAVAPSPVAAAVDLGQEIRSAGTDVLTSAGLADFRNLLLKAGEECVELTTEIADAQPKATAARLLQLRWERGFLFRRIRKARFAEICEDADTAEARLNELQEQLNLARLATEITVEADIAKSYSQLCDSFAAMTQAKCIWDTLTRQATNRLMERTAASESITRERVAFKRGQSDILNCEWQVPVLENKSGGDMFLYPAFVLYRVTKDSFAVIDVQDVGIDYSASRFIERETIPADSPTIGHTWLKVNKDGSRDKRFRDNVQIPIVQYGTLKLKSATGLNEEYMVSSPSLAQRFARDWASFKSSFKPSSPKLPE
jgi:hypothetical protein